MLHLWLVPLDHEYLCIISMWDRAEFISDGEFHPSSKYYTNLLAACHVLMSFFRYLLAYTDYCPFTSNKVMAHSKHDNSGMEVHQMNNTSRKPRILLAASGSVAAIKFANLCHCFSEWAEVKAVATKASKHFIDTAALPKDVTLYTDEDEWSSWNKLGDSVLHIELRRWADIMVIAPLSANTLGKIAGGLCDNLLTCIIRAWDFSKPMFVAPAMNTFMWNNPFTERHLMVIDDLGISLIPPVSKRLACGDYGNGAMAEPSLIYSTIRLFFESRENSNGVTI